MNIQLLILIAGIIIAILCLVKYRSILSLVIILIQIVSIIPYLVNASPLFVSIGYYLFGISILLVFIYPFILQEKKISKKIVLLFFSSPLLISYIFELFNFSEYGLIRWSILISIGIYLYVILYHANYKNELGFMSLFIAIVLIKFINLSKTC